MFATLVSVVSGMASVHRHGTDKREAGDRGPRKNAYILLSCTAIALQSIHLF